MSDDAAQPAVEALGPRGARASRPSPMSSPQMTPALVDAHQRGVSVEVILVGNPAKGRHRAAAPLAQTGIAVLTDKVHASTGLLVISDPTLAARYVREARRPLRDLGYQPGPVGPRTKQALARYQRGQRIAVTGRHDSQAMVRFDVQKRLPWACARPVDRAPTAPGTAASASRRTPSRPPGSPGC